MLFRLLLFSLIVLASIFAHPLIVVPLVFFYAMNWYSLETIVLAALIDSYFHAINNYPVYTIGAFIILLSTELIKRYLRFV